MKGVLLLSILFCLSEAALYYKPNTDYVYDTVGTVDARGQQTSGTRSGGSTSKMTGQFVIAVYEQNATYYEMVCNGFNFVVSAGEDKSTVRDLGNAPLGDPMYFLLNKVTGEIPIVYYDSADSPYYVNVKLGLINAFQTHMLPQGQSKQVTESDITGLHTSMYTAHPTGFTISKTFTQHNVLKFSDPTVSPSDVVLAASAVQSFHTEGYMLTATVGQHIVAKPGDYGAPTPDTGVGFNSLLSSKGDLTLNLSQQQIASKFSESSKSDIKQMMSGSIGDIASNSVSTIRRSHEVRAASLVAKYSKDPSLVRKVAPYTRSPLVRNSIRRVLQSKLSVVERRRVMSLLKHGEQEVTPVDTSSFPFNKSVAKNYTLGGDTIGLNVGGSLFAGTNFNCKQPTFNYEASAVADASILVLGKEGEAFRATAIYGAKGGQHLANEVEVQLFGKTYYHKALPSIDCSPHYQQLAHSAPGFDWTYTLWVSIIPVTFDAGAHLDLSVGLTWDICDTTLSASINVNPAADLVISGGAEIDLLLLQAGISIDAAFQTTLIPQLDLKGSLCSVGFELTRTNKPMSAKLDAFYRFKKCKFLFFDCHWEKTNELDLWEWDLPSSTSTLFKKSWAIAK